ncbi:hypothetical protein ACFQMA_05245 [Halosimplex aquaticum]|uniref:Uncharacterized protein n=1 Tax=Halosimplex aquaticum TaxID=3026162 RepID=A0ABD5Y076_9EURY|nr:hypothetical protein [Halosimplex aquaticum]
MDPETLPLVGAVFRFGAEDRVLDSILLAGPLVVLAMVLFEQSPVTFAVVALYVVSFVAYVAYNGARR